MRLLPTLLLLAACRLGPEADAPDVAASGAPALATVQTAAVPEAEVSLDTLARNAWGQPMTPGEFYALVAAVDTATSSGVDLLTGAMTFHSDEADVRDGERWQGLYPTEAGVELRSFAVTVDRVYDSLLDPEDGPFTGVRVRTPFSAEPLEDGYAFDPAIALVRRVNAPFPDGPVPTAFVGFWEVQPGNLSLTLGETQYVLSVHAGPEAVPGGRPERVVELSDGTTTQPLTTLNAEYNGLQWAGDLDGDGRLDLLLGESPHYNVSLPTLYLSSQAASGALVARVAQHYTTGC